MGLVFTDLFHWASNAEKLHPYKEHQRGLSACHPQSGMGRKRGNKTLKSNWQNICGLKCLDVFASPIDVSVKHYNQKIRVVTSQDFNGQNCTANLNISLRFLSHMVKIKTKI